jgi:hypothetical protein
MDSMLLPVPLGSARNSNTKLTRRPETIRLLRRSAGQPAPVQDLGRDMYEGRASKQTAYRRLLHQATLLSGQQAQGEEHECSAYNDDWRGRKYNFLGACELPNYNKRAREAEHGGVFCAGCETAFENASKAGGAAMWVNQAHDRVFSKATFLEHIKWCKEAQRLWTSSGEGSQTPRELGEGFGYFTPRNEDGVMDEEFMCVNKYSCRFDATPHADDRSVLPGSQP